MRRRRLRASHRCIKRSRKVDEEGVGVSRAAARSSVSLSFFFVEIFPRVIIYSGVRVAVDGPAPARNWRAPLAGCVTARSRFCAMKNHAAHI